MQRIGLSATQRPLEEIGRFVSGGRPIEIVDAGRTKGLDLEVVVPLDDMREPGEGAGNSIWPSIYPALLELVEAHRSTIVFVNNRRLAERLAVRLNELAEATSSHPPPALPTTAPPDRSRASRLARPRAAGRDRGAPEEGRDPVPRRDLVARARHRHGRGRPRDPGGIAEVGCARPSAHRPCGPYARSGLEGADLPEVPRRPARGGCRRPADARGCDRGDADPAKPARRPRPADRRDLRRRGDPGRASSTSSSAARGTSATSRALRSRTCSTCSPAATRPRSSRSSGRGSSGTGSAESSAAVRALVSSRSRTPARSPTGASSACFSPTEAAGSASSTRRWCTRPVEGQTFMLGASTWRIEEITRDRVLVSRAGRARARSRSGRARAPAVHSSSARRGQGGPRARRAFRRGSNDPAHRGVLARRACRRNLVTYLREQEQATGAVPSDRTIVVERFRDEIGDWRLCILTPFGGRVHAPWSLALASRLRESLGLEVNTLWSDDGIALHLPDAEAPPPIDDVLVGPDEVEELVVQELGGSALFGARFRENAARALLIPRRRPGQRTPLWQQRLKAQGLLQVARRYADFPIVLETYRECLQDVFDLPALRRLLGRPRAPPDRPRRRGDGIGLALRLLAALRLRRDVHVRGRHSAGRAPGAGARRSIGTSFASCSGRRTSETSSTAKRSRRSKRSCAAAHAPPTSCTTYSCAAASRASVSSTRRLAAELERDRRAVKLRFGGREWLVAAEDAGRYRDAFGAMPPGGLPDAFLEAGEHPLAFVLVRFARGRGPFTTGEVARRFGLARRASRGGARVSSSATAGSCVASSSPAEASASGATRMCCGACVGRRSPGCARRSSRSSRRRSAASCRPGRGSTDGRACGRHSCRSRASRSPSRCGRRTSCRAACPATGPSSSTSSVLLARWSGSARGLERVALYYREDAPSLGRPGALPAPEGVAVERLRAALAAGALFWHDLVATTELDPEIVLPALWELVWAGEVTNDAWQPLRASRRYATHAPVTPRSRSRRFSRQRTGAVTATQGRWSLAAPLFAGETDPRALAELLLERQGIVTRDGVRGEGIPGGYGARLPGAAHARDDRAVCRRGYFVEGLGGAQFALPGAVERLRERADEQHPLVLAAADPAQPYGASLSWPKRAGGRAARIGGAYVVLLGGHAALFVERGGRSLLPLRDPEEDWLRAALAALVDQAERLSLKRLAIERFDGAPVIESEVLPLLVEAGFQAGPRRAVLRTGA